MYACGHITWLHLFVKPHQLTIKGRGRGNSYLGHRTAPKVGEKYVRFTELIMNALKYRRTNIREFCRRLTRKTARGAPDAIGASTQL